VIVFKSLTIPKGIEGTGCVSLRIFIDRCSERERERVEPEP
jgi:hypothetical protein